MNWLPRGTVLGDLELLETFIFYDGPRVFSCRSLTDQLYIAAWAEEGEDADQWLYAPVSQRRLNLIRSGGMTLRSAFTRPEGFVYLVAIPDDEDQQDSIRPIPSSQLLDSWLPADDFRLALPTLTAKPAESPDEIKRRVLQENRTRMRIKLAHPDSYRTEAPTRQVGEILILTQKLLDNVGLALDSDEAPAMGRIPNETAKKMSSEVVELSAASFVIELAASSLDDLFGESLFADSTKVILDLLDPELQSESISAELSGLGPRAAKSFRRFVAGLADSGANVAMSAAGSNFDYLVRELPLERLETLVYMLNRLVPDTDVVEIRGRMELFAYDSDRRTFGLQDKDGNRYEGKVDDRASAQSSHPTINDRYDVLVFATSVLDEVVGETKVTYTLSQLVSVAEDDD